MPKEMSAEEVRALYEGLKKLHRQADWMFYNRKTVPIDLNINELIALQDLLHGFRKHYRRLKRKATRGPANDVA